MDHFLPNRKETKLLEMRHMPRRTLSFTLGLYTGLHFTGVFRRVWPPLEATLVIRSMWWCCAAGASLELKALNQPVMER